MLFVLSILVKISENVSHFQTNSPFNSETWDITYLGRHISPRRRLFYLQKSTLNDISS